MGVHARLLSGVVTLLRTLSNPNIANHVTATKGFVAVSKRIRTQAYVSALGVLLTTRLFD